LDRIIIARIHHIKIKTREREREFHEKVRIGISISIQRKHPPQDPRAGNITKKATATCFSGDTMEIHDYYSERHTHHYIRPFHYILSGTRASFTPNQSITISTTK